MPYVEPEKGLFQEEYEQPCFDCDGAGEFESEELDCWGYCSTCDGTGTLE